MVNNNQLKKIILQNCAFLQDLKAVALYGSCSYKGFSNARDFDAFVVFKNKYYNSGRLSISLSKENKNINIYLINEFDFYDDIFFQKFGLKFAMFFFHGYLPLYNKKACFKYYLESMRSIVFLFKLEIVPQPMDFFVVSNLIIMKAFPSFIKSSLDFNINSALRKRNYKLYKKCYKHLIFAKKTYSRNINQKYLATLFTAFFRSSSDGTITNIEVKKSRLLKRLEDEYDYFIATYGTSEYETMVSRIEEYFEEIQNLIREADFDDLPLKNYSLIKINV